MRVLGRDKASFFQRYLNHELLMVEVPLNEIQSRFSKISGWMIPGIISLNGDLSSVVFVYRIR